MKFTKESFIRAVRTFFQSVIAYVLVNIAVVDFSNDNETIRSALIGLIISAIAGGISAVMNMENVGDNQNEI